VLRDGSRSRGWRREIGTFEVVGCEVGHTTGDIGSKLGNRLLDLRWVVVRLTFESFRDPVGSLFKKPRRIVTN
jgi:hypothetical protein